MSIPGGPLLHLKPVYGAIEVTILTYTYLHLLILTAVLAAIAQSSIEIIPIFFDGF